MGEEGELFGRSGVNGHSDCFHISKYCTVCSDSNNVGVVLYARWIILGQFRDKIVPIEVKSGENVRAKSLKIYRETYQPKLAVRMSMKDLAYDNGLLNIPLYESFAAEKFIGEMSR